MPLDRAEFWPAASCPLHSECEQAEASRQFLRVGS